jgi:hypothetical protein
MNDPVLISRLQFVFSVMFLRLWPVLTIRLNRQPFWERTAVRMKEIH